MYDIVLIDKNTKLKGVVNMYNEKNKEVVRIYNETKKFNFIQKDKEKSEGDLVCVLDMNVPLCVPIYIFRQLTKMSNEEIYSQANESLIKSEFDDRFYSDDKLSRQLYVARNIKSLLSKEELRNFSKEQIKFIAEKVDAYRIEITNNFEKLDKTAIESYKGCNDYHNYSTMCFNIENFEEIQEIQEVENYEYGSNKKARDEFLNLNANKPYLFIQQQEEGNEDRSYGWEIDEYTKYTLYIPEGCIYSSLDEDILEIIKKFNL
jgi:hypothetical protein